MNYKFVSGLLSICFVMLILSPLKSLHAIELNENSFERTSSNLVVEYVQTHDMLGPAQAIVVLVYGDGRVEVTLPTINPRTGRYQMVLAPEELDELVLNVIEADRAPVLAREEVGLFYISDSTRTVIKVNANSVTSSSGLIEQISGPISIVESDLGLKRSEATDQAASRTDSLFSVEQQLLDLTFDSRLQRN